MTGVLMVLIVILSAMAGYCAAMVSAHATIGRAYGKLADRWRDMPLDDLMTDADWKRELLTDRRIFEEETKHLSPVEKWLGD